MARKLTIGIGWEGNVDWQGLIDRGKLVDEAGIHAIWMAEAWGRDAFTPLTLLAEHTKKVLLGTNIVNTYSRTPGALAQHFATLDGLSNGRMIIGLGTSGPNVIEHFHGIKFNPAVRRMEETVDIINMLMAGTPLQYEGKLFKLQRGFTLRFETQRKHIPIFIGAIKQQESGTRRAQGRRMAAGDDPDQQTQRRNYRLPRDGEGGGARSDGGAGQRVAANSRYPHAAARPRRPGQFPGVLLGADGHLLFRATDPLRVRRRGDEDQAGVGRPRREGGSRRGIGADAG